MDYHATTPVDPRVLKAMLPFFSKKFGNAASRTHFFGQEAYEAVERARVQVASLIGASSSEIVFTSGATESNNLAIKGIAKAVSSKGDHLVTVVTEHKSVLDPLKRLGFEGFRITYLPVRKDGLINLEDFKKALTNRTVLVSVMFAQNEIGVIQPIREIAKIARSRGALVHCDAAQAAGKLPLNVKDLGVDLLSFSAHKIYGPKGIGALYVRKSEPQFRLIPMLDGGGHEIGLRSGTLNVAGIVGFGAACEICRLGMRAESKKIGKLRDRLRDGLFKRLKGCVVNGSEEFRLPNNLNLLIPGISSLDLLGKLRGIALSAGSACLSSSPEPSYVLKAIGLSREEQLSSVRFGLGRFNTREDVDTVIGLLTEAVKVLKR